HALAKWMNHPLVNLRSRENEPEIRSRLSQLPNQYMVWGKVYSSLLLDEIEADPEIRALLPSDIIQHDASRTRINPQDLRFIRATSTVMKESLLSNIFKFWDKRNGVSGSHLHTHVLSTSMLALTDEQ